MSSSLDRVRERRRLEQSGASSGELHDFDDAPYRGDDRATGEDRRQLRSRARRQEQTTRDAYRQGRRQGRQERTRRRRTPAPARRAARQLVRPVQQQLTSGFQLLGIALGLVLLYQLLLTAESAPKQLQQLFAVPSGVLRWLANPHAVVLPS